MIESITRSQLFRNKGSVISLQCRWRQLILESLVSALTITKVSLLMAIGLDSGSYESSTLEQTLIKE